MNYVWAFNPFDRNKKLDKKTIALIRTIPGAEENLEAVFVASPNYAGLTAAFDIPEQDRFSRYPKRLIQSSMKTLGIKAKKYTVLVEKTVSLTKSVKELANYLTRNKASVVLVASRAKSGLSRFVLGSFAESLVHYSHVDLLIFNESTSISKRPAKNLLFAYDYSRAADKGLSMAINYAKIWQCSLHVVHVPDPIYSLKFKDMESEIENYRKRIRKKMLRIEEKVKKAKVFGSVALDSRWSPVADRILKRASEVKADIVMVVAKSGKLSSFFGGSVTRQILRASQVPVLVIKKL